MKKRTRSILLLILTAVLAAMSFGPCVEVTKTSVIDLEDLGFREILTEYDPYLPGFFCAVAALELLLLIFPKRRWLRVAGIILLLCKTAAPILLYRSGVLYGLGGLYSYHYGLSWLGYLLMLVSAGALAMYLWDLLKD